MRKLESLNHKIPGSSQTPGNEFFGHQRNIRSWANSPILQTRKQEFRERLPRQSGPRQSGSPVDPLPAGKNTLGFLCPPDPKTSRLSSNIGLSLFLGKTDWKDRGWWQTCSLGEILCPMLTRFIFYPLCPGVVGPLSFLPATPPGLFHFLFYRVSFPAPTLPSWGPGHLGPLGIGGALS